MSKALKEERRGQMSEFWGGVSILNILSLSREVHNQVRKRFYLNNEKSYLGTVLRFSQPC